MGRSRTESPKIINKPKSDEIRTRMAGENLETKVLQSGEKFTVSFQVSAKDKFAHPIYALTIKDAKGQQVYGQNTHFAKIATKDLKKDDKVLVKFVQYCNLNEGDYFISLGLTRFKDKNLEIVHRRYDVLEVKIICTEGSFGCSNCFIASMKASTFILTGIGSSGSSGSNGPL